MEKTTLNQKFKNKTQKQENRKKRYLIELRKEMEKTKLPQEGRLNYKVPKEEQSQIKNVIKYIEERWEYTQENENDKKKELKRVIKWLNQKLARKKQGRQTDRQIQIYSGISEEKQNHETELIFKIINQGKGKYSGQAAGELGAAESSVQTYQQTLSNQPLSSQLLLHHGLPTPTPLCLSSLHKCILCLKGIDKDLPALEEKKNL